MTINAKIKRGIVSVRAQYDVVAAIESAEKEIVNFKNKYDKKVDDLSVSVDEANSKIAAFQMNGSGLLQQTASVGSLLRNTVKEDPAFAHLAAWNQGSSARIDLPEASIQGALVNEPNKGTSENTMPGRIGQNGIVAQPARRLGLFDVLPFRKVDSLIVESVRLRPKGEAGIQAIEGAEKTNVELAGTPQKTHIVTIAGWTSASRQVLSDHNQLGGVVDTVLRNIVKDKLEKQLVNGTGNSTEASQIAGIMPNGTVVTGLTATTYADRLGEAVNRMVSDGYNPTFILANPLDWFNNIQVQRSLPDGQYLYGSPTTPSQPTLWGLPVVFSSSVEVGDAAVVDTDYVTVLDRMAVSLLTSNSHADFFARNMIAILCETRAGLEILDAGAIRVISATGG